MKEHIIETVEVSSRSGIDKLINAYLSLGWVIVETWVEGYGDPRERHETLHVLLGWIDRFHPAELPSKKQV